MKKYQATPPKDDGWRDLRDSHGKLCARFDVKRLVIQIRRSDRNLMAEFDLHDYLVDLRLKPKDD